VAELSPQNTRSPFKVFSLLASESALVTQAENHFSDVLSRHFFFLVTSGVRAVAPTFVGISIVIICLLPRIITWELWGDVLFSSDVSNGPARAFALPSPFCTLSDLSLNLSLPLSKALYLYLRNSYFLSFLGPDLQFFD